MYNKNNQSYTVFNVLKPYLHNDFVKNKLLNNLVIYFIVLLFKNNLIS